jgi:hypothetical protein
MLRREADEHLDHAGREAAPCGLTGVIIKQSLLERASGLVLYPKVINYKYEYCRRQ